MGIISSVLRRRDHDESLRLNIEGQVDDNVRRALTRPMNGRYYREFSANESANVIKAIFDAAARHGYSARIHRTYSRNANGEYLTQTIDIRRIGRLENIFSTLITLIRQR